MSLPKTESVFDSIIEELKSSTTFRILGNFSQKAKSDEEQSSLNFFFNKERVAINMALSILRQNRLFKNDPSFQDITESEIAPETKETNILYNKDRFRI